MSEQKRKSLFPRNIRFPGKVIWSEDRIRAEIIRLDKKTGLEGAKLPILFSNTKRTLGQFFPPRPDAGAPMFFRFSHHWFQNPDWCEEMAVDTIRHEYAHYMDWMLNSICGHGPTWMACCRKIGAMPERLYRDSDNERIKQQHREEAEKAAALQHAVETFGPGRVIRHPRFGEGCIRALTGPATNMRADVFFESSGMHTLSLNWLAANCRTVA